MNATPDQKHVLTRRELLQHGLGSIAVISLAASVPTLVTKLAFADKPSAQPGRRAAGENILVIVQFSGGNDGLNTVIPLGNDVYAKARPVIGISGPRLLKLNDQLALNPGMTGFKELFDEGKLAVINGCGYPQPNRSHFRSMDIWHTADPKVSTSTGWLGHYVDHCLRGTANPLKAVNIGSQLPLALVAESAPVPSIQSIDDFRVQTDRSNPADAKTAARIIRDVNAARNSMPAMEYLSRQATNALLAVDEVHKVSLAYKPDAAYPNQGLGRQLKLIAQLIAGGFGTRVFYCQIGGFDTHANQVTHHENLLRQCATAIREFHRDLDAKGLGKKVTLMCFSEFGRRVAQNGSNGTDHGAAAPMFVSGGAVRGGIHGSHPSLTDLTDGDLKFTTDFRRVYATLLDRWLVADSKTVLGAAYEHIGIL